MVHIWFKTLDGAFLRMNVVSPAEVRGLRRLLGESFGEPNPLGLQLFSKGKVLDLDDTIELEEGQVFLAVLSLPRIMSEFLNNPGGIPYTKAAQENDCEKDLKEACIRVQEANEKGSPAFAATELLLSGSGDGDDPSQAALRTLIGALTGSSGHELVSEDSPSILRDNESSGPSYLRSRERPAADRSSLDKIRRLLNFSANLRRQRAGGRPGGRAEISEEAVEQLVAVMGGSEDKVRRALQLTGGNMEEAMNLLLDGDDRLNHDVEEVEEEEEEEADEQSIPDEVLESFIGDHPEVVDIVNDPRIEEAVTVMTTRDVIPDDPPLINLIRRIGALFSSI